jgi:hypothetical protein
LQHLLKTKWLRQNRLSLNEKKKKRQLEMVLLIALAWVVLAAGNEALVDLLSKSIVGGHVKVQSLSEEQRASLGYVGRYALVAQDDLAPPLQLASIDWSSCLKAATVSCETCSATEKLMLQVVSDSRPAWVQDLGLNSPVTWTSHELLEGTQLGSQLKMQIAELKESFERNLKTRYPSVTFEQWKEAFSIVKALVSEKTADDFVHFMLNKQEQTFYAGVDDPRVVPWIALFSFGEKGKAHLHEPEEGKLEIWLSKPVSKGEMVSVNDDEIEESSNTRLFPLYGMLLKRRGDDFSSFCLSCVRSGLKGSEAPWGQLFCRFFFFAPLLFFFFFF